MWNTMQALESDFSSMEPNMKESFAMTFRLAIVSITFINLKTNINEMTIEQWIEIEDKKEVNE